MTMEPEEIGTLIAEAEALCGHASAAPWTCDPSGDHAITMWSEISYIGRLSDMREPGDAAFIVRARTLIPELVAALKAGEGAEDAAPDLLAALQGLLEWAAIRSDWFAGGRAEPDDHPIAIAKAAIAAVSAALPPGAARADEEIYDRPMTYQNTDIEPAALPVHPEGR